MIKVLFLPLNFGDIVQAGVYDAFRKANCELEVFDYYYIYEKLCRNNVLEVRKRLIDKCVSFRPDLIHMQIQHTTIIDGETIKQIKLRCPKAIISNWTGDVRSYVPNTYTDVARHSDFNLVSSTGQIDMFRRKLNKDVRYWQIGFNPNLYFPGSKQDSYDWDIVFIANNNLVENYPGRAERERACQLLRQAFGKRFGLFGNQWAKSFGSLGSVEQPTVGQLYHKSFAVLSVSHFNDIDHYFSDRLLMCLASGRPTVSLKFPKWESYFTHNSDIVIADSVDDIIPRVKWLLDNPDRAEFIGESGANKALSEHTYSSRIIELLEMVGLK